MLLQPVADLLKASGIGFRKVAGAANFAAAREDIKGDAKHAYVIPLNDSAGPNALANGAVMQQVRETFGVILAVDNKRDVRGDAVNAPLEDIRQPTIQSLLGKQHDPAYEPIEYVGGTLLELDVSTLYWQLTFSTGYIERNF